jgi:hypothetical protein
MERGPVALFGAIVAVGLGPALWLGAQFGSVSVDPVAPPAVVGEQKVDTGKAPGAAGAAPEDAATEPTRRAQYVPIAPTPSARTSTRATVAADDPDDETTPPAEETTEPTDPSDGGGGDAGEPSDTQPPAPDEPSGGDTTAVNLASR